MHDYSLLDVPCRVCHLLVKARGMFMHMKTHYMTFTCATCDKEFKDSDAMDKHINTSPNRVCDPDAWPCTNCGEVFDTESNLLAHIDTLHRHRKQQSKRIQKELKCETCAKVFTTRQGHCHHMRTHTGERPFACPHCPKTFRVKTGLQFHMNVHTGARPYRCSHCPKAFTTIPNLHRHRHDVHENRRPYECTFCNKTFNQFCGLKVHITTVHMKIPAPPRKRKRKTNLSSIVKCEESAEGSEESGEGCEESGEGCEESGEGCEESGEGCEEMEDGQFIVEHFEELE